MNMSVDEICRNYRQAKDKKEQIKILADLNCTSKDEIIKVLVDCGEMEPPESRPKKTSKKHAAKLPEPVAQALFTRIDELDKLIKPLEDQRDEINERMKPLRNEFMAISEFLMNYGCDDERRKRDVQI